MSENLRERLARAMCPIIFMHTDYSDVPTHEVFDRPRYAHLRERALEAADAAIAIVLDEAAAALVKRARDVGRQECCGRGVTDSKGRYQECCGSPDLVLTVGDATAVILALKEPKA